MWKFRIGIWRQCANEFETKLPITIFDSLSQPSIQGLPRACAKCADTFAARRSLVSLEKIPWDMDFRHRECLVGIGWSTIFELNFMVAQTYIILTFACKHGWKKTKILGGFGISNCQFSITLIGRSVFVTNMFTSSFISFCSAWLWYVCAVHFRSIALWSNSNLDLWFVVSPC